MTDRVPPKGSDQWKKNEKTINSNGFLRQMRDRSEGIEKSKGKYHNHGGKGSAQRPGNEQAYRDNWERIFGGDRKNVNHREAED